MTLTIKQRRDVLQRLLLAAIVAAFLNGSTAVRAEEFLNPLGQAGPLPQGASDSEAHIGIDGEGSCNMPLPHPDEKVVFLGVDEGGTISNVTVGGQTSDTGVVRLDFAKGTDKLYLVAVGLNPVIWDVAGDVQRVSRIVLIGPVNQETKQVMAGIAGVASKNISFLRLGSCIGSLPMDYLSPELTEALLKPLGKAPALSFTTHAIIGAHVSNEITTDDSVRKENQVVPDGLDGDLWAELLILKPGGLTDMKPRKILSDMPSEPYAILPEWAGLAQLIHEGAVLREVSTERSVILRKGRSPVIVEGVDIKYNNVAEVRTIGSNNFKLIRRIDHYPVGLNGYFSVNFVIGQGVPLPSGSPGTSCVISEETGSRSDSCPPVAPDPTLPEVTKGFHYGGRAQRNDPTKDGQNSTTHP